MADDKDGDSRTVDEERPLKKARHVWQIKGRYRWNHPRSRSCTTASASYSCQPAPAPSPRIEEDQVLRWQTRQLARAVFDNTINQVLEDMGFIPPPPDSDEDIVNFEVYPSNNNREGIENAAILMAIQSHGLQKPCHCSHSHSLAASSSSSSSVQNIPFHHRPSSPLLPESRVSQSLDDFSTPSTSSPQEKYAGETDFLAQAVAAAIQKKGIGSFSQSEHG